MGKKILNILFVTLFMVLCLVPVFGLLIAGPAEAGANEVLASEPELIKRDGSLNLDWPGDLADYIDDRFFPRQEAVTAWAKLNAALKSSASEDVLLGGDGWLYYAPTLDDYTRSAPMTGRELWCAARRLYLLQEAAEGRGGRFLFTIAPNKNSLYPAHMPDYPRGDGPSNAQALGGILADMGVRYLDLAAVFGEQAEELYFPTDSHWNGRGAALAADAILSALGRESGYFQGEFAPASHRGDLYEMLYPAGTDTDPDYAFAPGFTFAAASRNADDITIATESAAGEDRLLMYRDSFGRNLYPYLAESFAQAVFSRKNNYEPGAMPEGGCLVVELVERNLRYLNMYAPILPAPVRDSGLAENALPASAAVALTPADGAPEGYAALAGDYGGLAPDPDTPVYVSAGGRLYEACPGPEGFCLALPEGAESGGLRVIFAAGGNLLSLPGVITYE